MRSLSTSIVENAADAILTTDSAGTITSWNKAAEQIYGYFVAEVIGKNISLLTPQEQSDDSLAPREVPYQGVKIQKCKDGTLLTVLVSVSALRDDRGKNTGLVVIARKIADDLTERKKAEKKLHLWWRPPPPAYSWSTVRVPSYWSTLKWRSFLATPGSSC